MNNIVEFDNVQKKFRQNEVLNNINFTIGKQEIIGLVGANGAGKTTLMRILVGLTQKYTGTIRSLNNQRLQIGCVIESPSFYGYLTGYQNLIHFSKYIKSSKSEVLELLALIGLKEVSNRKVKTYSLGMRQRLGIAQALLGQPDLLVLDEPTNGLDPQGVQEMRNYLKRIVKERNVSILMSSHILSEIEKTCDRIMLLKDGLLTENIQSLLNTAETDVEYLYETQTPERLLDFLRNQHFVAEQEDTTIVVRLNKKNISTVMKDLLSANISFEGVTERKRSLEEQFIHIVGGNKR